MLGRKSLYLKIILAQVGAYVLSSFLVTQVFLVESPLVRPDLPTKMVSQVNTIASSVHSMVNFSETAQNFSRILNPATSDETPISNGSGDSNNNQQSQGNSEYPTPTPLPDSPAASPEPTNVAQIVPNSTPAFSWPDDLTKWISSIPRMNLPTPFPTRPRAAAPTQTSDNSNVSLSTLEQQTITLINQKRAAEGKSKLAVNGALTQAARILSADNASRSGIGQCSHFGSDGADFIKRAKQAGYSGTPYGETIGCAHNSAESIVNGWWSSPPHHAILTNSQVKYIGVGWKSANHSAQTAVVGF